MTTETAETFTFTQRPLFRGNMMVIERMILSGEAPENWPNFAVEISASIQFNDGRQVPKTQVVEYRAEDHDGAFAQARALVQSRGPVLLEQLKQELGLAPKLVVAQPFGAPPKQGNGFNPRITTE